MNTDNASSRLAAAAVMRWAREQPNSIALSDTTASLSYAELSQRVEEVFTWLKKLNISANEHILVVAENSVALATLILAANLAGVVVVLENARRAPAEIDAIRAHCAARFVIFLFSNSGDAKSHAMRCGAKAGASPSLCEFSVLAETQSSVVSATAAEKCTGDTIAVIIYTTGTTGQPKGVMLPHRALDFISSRMRDLRYVTPLDRVYGLLPITHVMGLASVLYGALVSGAHLHLVARFSAGDCVAYIRKHGVTMLQGAPAMFAKIVDYCRANGIARLDTLRFIGSGGAPIDPTIKRDAEELFGTTLHNGYGLTEAASTCWTRFEDENRDETVGRPLPGVEIRVDEKSSKGIGELWTRGPHVMAGYFRDPVRTAEVLTDDGWFNTQDLARISDDGLVYIVGRTKDIIIRSGFNVYPLEVEMALSAHTDVLHCAVLGRPVKGNEEILAFVELAQGASATPESLSAFLAERLSPYKRPNEIVVMDSLPIAANGKVLKSQLAFPVRN